MNMAVSFARKIYRLLEQIPAGKVTTYGSLARAAGRPQSCRAVGQILRKNQNRVKVPCHRVVYADRRIGGYAGGVFNKVSMLKKEGVLITQGKVNETDIIEFKS